MEDDVPTRRGSYIGDMDDMIFHAKRLYQGTIAKKVAKNRWTQQPEKIPFPYLTTNVVQMRNPAVRYYFLISQLFMGVLLVVVSPQIMLALYNMSGDCSLELSSKTWFCSSLGNSIHRREPTYSYGFIDCLILLIWTIFITFVVPKLRSMDSPFERESRNGTCFRKDTNDILYTAAMYSTEISFAGHMFDMPDVNEFIGHLQTFGEVLSVALVNDVGELHGFTNDAVVQKHKKTQPGIYGFAASNKTGGIVDNSYVMDDLPESSSNITFDGFKHVVFTTSMNVINKTVTLAEQTKVLAEQLGDQAQHQMQGLLNPDQYPQTQEDQKQQPETHEEEHGEEVDGGGMNAVKRENTLVMETMLANDSDSDTEQDVLVHNTVASQGLNAVNDVMEWGDELWSNYTCCYPTCIRDNFIVSEVDRQQQREATLRKRKNARKLKKALALQEEQRLELKMSMSLSDSMNVPLLEASPSAPLMMSDLEHDSMADAMEEDALEKEEEDFPTRQRAETIVADDRNSLTVVRAIVTFMKIEDNQRMQHKFNNRIARFFRPLGCCQPRKYKPCKLSVVNAREPSDYIFPNMRYSALQKWVRRTAGFFIILLLVCSNVFVIYLSDISTEKPFFTTMALSIGLSVYQRLMYIFILLTAAFSKRDTHSAEQVISFRAKMVVLTCNFYLIPLFVYGLMPAWNKDNPDENDVTWSFWERWLGNEDWYGSFGVFITTQVFTDCAMEIGVQLWQPAAKIRTWILMKKAKTQAEVNKAQMGPQMTFYQLYSSLAMSANLAILYGSVLPLIAVLCLVKVLVIFFVQKYNFLRVFPYPRATDHRLALLTIKRLSTFLILRYLMSLWAMRSTHFGKEYITHTDDGWDLPEPAQVVTIYGLTIFSLWLVYNTLAALWYMFEQLFCHGWCFMGAKRHEASEYPLFLEVPNIECFVPL